MTKKMEIQMTQILTKRRKRWAANRDVTLKGTQLNYNAATQIYYQRALLKMVDEMTYDTTKKVTRLFQGEEFKSYQKQVGVDASISSQARIVMNKLKAKFVQLFASNASSIANQMLSKTMKNSQSSLHASLQQLSGGLSLKTSVVPPGMNDIVKASVNENVSYIQSIPEAYLTKVSTAVMRSITTGTGLNSLLPEIQKYSAESKRKTQLLALDQTRKAYNNINKIRMQAIGIEKFQWVHSASSQKPRKSHIKLAAPPDNIYSFNDLPIINQEQVDSGSQAPERGIPGQAINCRCTMIPVISFDD